MIWKNIIRYSISIATIVGIWKFIIFIFTVPDFILPAPSQVMTVLFTEKNLFLDHTKATIIHMGGGIGIGITLGILTGFAIAYSRTLLWLIEPYLTKNYNCSTECIRQTTNKHRRILDTLEPLISQHRIIFDKKVVKDDYELTNNLYSPE